MKRIYLVVILCILSVSASAWSFEGLSISEGTEIDNYVVYMSIYGNIHRGDVHSMYNDLLYLRKHTEFRKVRLFLCSSGGDSFYGISLADQIEAAQKEGFHFTVYATGIIASAALPILAVCDYRIATRGCQFLIHEACLVREGTVKDKASEIRAQSASMELLKKEYLRKMAKNTTLTATEWGGMMTRSTWLTSSQALAIRLINVMQ